MYHQNLSAPVRKECCSTLEIRASKMKVCIVAAHNSQKYYGLNR